MAGEERLRLVGQRLGPVGAELRGRRLHRLRGHALRVVVRPDQARQHRGYQGGAGDPLLRVPHQVVGDLDTAQRVPDQRGPFHAGVAEQGGQVVGEGVEVIAGGRTVGAAVPAPVEGDAAVAPLDEVGDLVLPHVGVQHDPGHEDDGLALAVVLVGQSRAVEAFEEHAPP
ncbi:hypothetical protein GCM10027203_68010 [Nonomuraea fastidiosa]